ncbi:GNAT family N-acetyltransferase [Acetobacter senegalensis]|uniref:GNAT family N-acetyltransferase n=1 Tax=Acetobacter senegalensis TaxID=446692 RepID=UPI00128B6881|nr:GNAT family N-acetyltransferase [Acetobacter senegalensis]MCG4257972.1 GNAT family N-acetyltransferase [Acetobacter senegalensis]MCG4267899.1 GNAT family N-acetyltransferase [Acetobacter senegalensis]MPQ73519.1 GNAT family N-acetyltransferase [Acetobacter senegalensis]
MEVTVFTVRLARQDDAPKLPAIERSAAQVFRRIPALAFLAEDEPSLSEADHRARIEQELCWVAVDSADTPCGFLSAALNGRDLHIVEVSVEARAQGAGLGRALLREVCDYARAHGMARVTLTTFRSVPWNAPFYERLGFREVLPEHESHLAGKVRQEEASGLPPGSRCAMVMVL